MAEVYLGLGSNVGDREQNLWQAVKLINNSFRIEVIQLSSVYKTKPWGYTDQPDFLNLCVEVKTELSPADLLAVCQQVEQKLDRQRTVRWGPRTIDVDILVYDQVTVEKSDLVLPHPRLTDRAFVLVPLGELNSSLVIQEKQITDWLKEVETEGVEVYTTWQLEKVK